MATDGLGRLLIPVYLLARGVIDRPLLYLSPYFEATRDDYIRFLKRVSTHGDWQTWVEYVLIGVEAQAIEARKRVDRLLELHDRYRERVRAGARSQSALSAVDIVMERVYVTAKDVADYIKRDHKTARSALETLSALGIVQPLSTGYPQRWAAFELQDLIYKD